MGRGLGRRDRVTRLPNIFWGGGFYSSTPPGAVRADKARRYALSRDGGSALA